VCAIVLLVSGSAIGGAQSVIGGDVLAQLLAEVRGLRLAMEQMAAAGPRVELALGRLQLQEQRVNTLVRRQESVRSSLSAAESEITQHQIRQSQLERALREAESAPGRAEIEEMLSLVKREAANVTASLQRLQAEDAALSGDIAAEQGRWSEINRALEELERSLIRR
jgi:chromosome segregation ATPase